MDEKDIDRKELMDELQALPGDYKASVIAAEIVDNGVPYDSIYFRNNSTFKRFISRDVESIDWSGDEQDQIVFELNREGLYDMLPEGITHSNTGRTSKQDMQNEFALHKEQEKYARKFFSTFEDEFMHWSLQLEIIERHLFDHKNYDKNRELFEHFFGDSKCLTHMQVISLLYMLPLANKIRSDVKLIADTLSKILNHSITVEKYAAVTKLSKTNGTYTGLSESRLGINSILSDNSEVYVMSYSIIVADVPNEQFYDFIAGSKHKNVIDFIIPYFFPIDATVQIVLNAIRDEKNFKLSIENDKSFLGFNSYI